MNKIIPNPAILTHKNKHLKNVIHPFYTWTTWKKDLLFLCGEPGRDQCSHTWSVGGRDCPGCLPSILFSVTTWRVEMVHAACSGQSLSFVKHILWRFYLYFILHASKDFVRSLVSNFHFALKHIRASKLF